MQTRSYGIFSRSTDEATVYTKLCEIPISAETQNLKTIEIYAHVSNKNLREIKSPLDSLEIKRGDMKNENK